MAFEKVAPRLRADYGRILDMCQAAGAKLVFATYLAGFEGTFGDIRAEMFAFGREHALPVADCTAVAIEAITGAAPEGASTNPASHKTNDPVDRVARFAAILTRDRHPTPLGYEMEARVVAAALAEAGCGAAPPSEPPLSPILRRGAEAPELARAEGGAGNSDTWDWPPTARRWCSARAVNRPSRRWRCRSIGNRSTRRSAHA